MMGRGLRVNSFAGPFVIADDSATETSPRAAARRPRRPPNSQSKPATPSHNMEWLAAWLRRGKVLSSSGA
jgi:hypothetical protein